MRERVLGARGHVVFNPRNAVPDVCKSLAMVPVLNRVRNAAQGASGSFGQVKGAEMRLPVLHMSEQVQEV